MVHRPHHAGFGPEAPYVFVAVALAEGMDLDEAMRWAMAAGALAVTRHGAQDSMPRRAEVKAFLAAQERR